MGGAVCALKSSRGYQVGYPLVQPLESKSTVGHGFPSKLYVLIDLWGQHYHPGI